MYERLLQLPLLQGMSTQDLENLVYKVQLDFNQHISGELIAGQEECCNKLIFIISGSLEVQYRDPNDDIIVTEYIDAPFVIEPYSMFGMSQKFTRDYYFLPMGGSSLTIPKSTFLNTFMNFTIIKQNMLNMLCHKAQQATKRLMLKEPPTVKEKIQNFILYHCINDKGTKHVKIKMDTLADMIGETRLNVSNTLREFSNNKLIQQNRNIFTIQDMQAFLRY